MKRLQKILLTAFLLFGCFPTVGNAMAPAELAAFLSENNWTEEELDSYLEYFYDMNLKDFNTVNELEEMLGEPITEKNLKALLKEFEFKSEEDLVNFLIENGEMEKGDNIRDVFRYIDALDSTIFYYQEVTSTPITDENLNELLEDYGMTMQELEDLLAKNKDSLDNYKNIEDLDMAITIYSSGDVLQDTFSQIGITEDEIQALTTHFENLNLDEAMVEEKMGSIVERLAPFMFIENPEEITDEQAVELASIIEEIFDIVELNPKFYLVKGNEKKLVTLYDLAKMKDTQGYDLLIELYNKKGDLLLDAFFPEEMINAQFIDKTVKDMKKVEKIVKKSVTSKRHTIKGGKLPNTAGNYAEGVMVGSLLILAGVIFYRRKKVQA